MDDTVSDVVYKFIEGYPGYRIGDDGSIWSQWRPCRKSGNTIGDSWRRLVGGTDKDGYKKVILCANGVRRYARVNILVLEAFVGPAPAGMVSSHGNGVRADNRLSNLRWDTQKNNIADKKKHGTHQAGEKHGCCKLTDDKVREIRIRRAAGDSCASLAKEFGVQKPAIYSIVKRKTWSHVA